MTPNSLSGAGVAGKATRRRAVRPPHITSAAWWLVFVLLLAAYVACQLFEVL